ncbi:GGDEF domain-containing protein [Crossiella cryophila]|uniref:Diguanylate cyclase (GGDEF)-like protein n=2 Tax=Crossiella cryophila TaxID=43355 RepID=A0A7W7FRF9_9PSEU|nr:GGDEF domain-containing protein [Crossiella cryophila]MBB4674303.1 diguanylate cyclase (GGDEF)-like protein [Crossiella cryophila]
MNSVGVDPAMYSGTTADTAHGLSCHACGQPYGYWATDPLTGLLDRRGWAEQAPAALHHAGNRESVLLVVDLDRFKLVNDEHGHLAGDSVLQAVGQVLRSVAHDSGIAARYGGHGGDEFLVLFPASDRQRAIRAARRIRAKIREMAVPVISTDGRPVVITGMAASIGVAVHTPDQGHDLMSLVRRADAAVLQAKRSGRDQIALAGD